MATLSNQQTQTVLFRLISGGIVWDDLSDKIKHQLITYINENSTGPNFGMNSDPGEIILTGAANTLIAMGVRPAEVKAALASSPLQNSGEGTGGGGGDTTTTKTPPPYKNPNEKLTKDDYLNKAIGAGLAINANIKDLAEQAAKQEWPMWKFVTKLKATNQYEQGSQAQYMAAANAWGLAITPNTQKLIDEAVKRGYSVETFKYYLEQTPEFAKAFPGIFDKNGVLKMDPSQYIDWRNAYQASAQTNGVHLGDRQVGMLMKNNVTPQRYDQLAQAESRLQQNDALMKQFQAELRRNGVAKEFSNEDMLKFMVGEGPKQWVELWNETVARYSATEAGIRVAKGTGLYNALGPKAVEQIASKGLDESQLAAGFAEVANNLLTTLPLSKIQGYGLTKNEILQASFGGPKSAEVKKKMEHILAQEEAFYQEPRASEGFTATQAGHTTTAAAGAARPGQ